MADSENKTRWMQIKIQTDGEIAEALAEVLGRFVSHGVVVESLTHFNPKTQENEPTGGLSVSGYLAVDEELETKRQKLEEALWHLSQITPIAEPESRPIKDENWMEAWKEHYHPIPVGENVLIMPSWNQLDEAETRTVIRINPAMAFGTGTHPTTQLCLRLLEKHHRLTGSGRASWILENWDSLLPLFVKVMPIDYRKALRRLREREQVSGEQTPATEEVFSG